MTAKPYRFTPCKDHPGRNVANHPCQHKSKDGSVCGWSPNTQAPQEGCESRPALSLVQNEELEADVEESTSAIAVESEYCAATLGFPDGTTVPLGHINRETGEFVGTHPLLRQPTLDDTIFPAVDRDSVPMVKLTFTGGIEMTEGEFRAYCEQGLEPGRIVKATLTGFLPNPHGRWVKRSEKDEETGRKHTWWELEGAVKVKVFELDKFELTGGVFDGE